MNSPSLGRLEKVELREVWTSEPGSFTPWLAREENLALLGQTLGIELELEKQEKEVGPFRADLLCKNIASDAWVLIENQLERTDHTHLGQLLTYAAGLQAVTIIWIAQKFTEEHRAALDWLNEITAEGVHFFGLEIELWRIGSSAIAPKFNVVSQPNEWVRFIQHQASSAQAVSDNRLLQQDFWTEFRKWMEEHGSPVKCQKPPLKSWTNFSMGSSVIHLSASVLTQDILNDQPAPVIRAEVIFRTSRAKELFARVLTQKKEIETALGWNPTWYQTDGTNMCRAFTQLPEDFQNRERWPTQFAWLRGRLEDLYRVFAPRIKSILDTEEQQPT